MIIDGIEYVPARPADARPTIAILQRGWVFAGLLSRDGDDYTLTKAVNVRVWGTTFGLGQLAAEGPKKDTKLDPAGTVRFHALTAVALIDITALWSEFVK